MQTKKLTLEEELKRFRTIDKYLLREAAGDEFDMSAFEGGNNQDAAGDQGQQPQDNGQQPAPDANQEFGQKPAPEPTIETTPEGDTTVDVSDLVKGIEDANNAAADSKMQIDNAAQRIEDLLNRIGGLEDKLGVMDALLQKVDQLGVSVEKMRPPTETERQQALKQSSYPFNLSPEDYANQKGERTATDLEQRQSKLSFKDILKDFNAMDVQSSFNYNDPINNEINNFMPPYRN